EGYKKADSAADEKSIHADVENAINGFPGHLQGYADQAQDELEAERRRTVVNDWLNLQRWVKELRKHYQERQGLATSSWFITNDRGDQLARAPLSHPRIDILWLAGELIALVGADHPARPGAFSSLLFLSPLLP